MYFHLGNSKVIRQDTVIGIFDLDNTTISKRTRKYLSDAEKKGEVEMIGTDLPKSFVVTAEKRGENKVYLTTVSSQTLTKRGGGEPPLVNANADG